MGKVKIGLYCYVTTDILTNILQNCSLSKKFFISLSYLPIDFIDHGQVTKKLKEQEFSFFPTTLILISWAHLWSFIMLQFKSYGNFH